MYRIGRLLFLFVFVCCTLCMPAFAAKQAKSIDDYVKIIRSGQSDDFYQAIDALSKSKDPRVLQELISICEDESVDEDARSSVAGRVSERIQNFDVEQLIPMLGSKSAELRQHVSGILAERRPAPKDKLAAHLNDNNPQIRAHIAAMLLRWKDEHGLQPLLACLEDADVEVRKTAAVGRMEVIDPKLTEIMKRLIKDNDDLIRASAVQYLSTLRDATLLDTFTDIALNDSSDHVRSAAVKGLGLIGDVRSVPTLIKIIKSDDIANDAAEALFNISDPEAVPLLIEALKDKNNSVRAIAVQCLMSFDDEDADDAILALLKDKKTVQAMDDISYRLPQSYDIEALNRVIKERKAARAVPDEETFDPPSYGNVKIPKLVADLKSKNNEKLQCAMDTLRGLKDKASVAPLIALMKDKDPDVQNNAVYLLGFMGDKRAYKPLLECVNKGARLSITAARALQRMGRYDLVSKKMVKLLDDKQLNTRTVAAVVIGDARDKSALKVLISKLKDPNPEFHKAVIFALSQIDTPEAAKALVPLMKATANAKASSDSPEDFDGSAFVFISAWHMKSASAIVPDLIDLLQSKNKDTRRDAAWILGRTKDPRAVEPLLAVLNSAKWDKEGGSLLIQKVVDALGEIGDARAVPTLIQYAEQVQDWNNSAIKALGKIHCEQSYQYLLKMLNGPFVANWSKASIGLNVMRDPRAAESLAARANLCPEAAIALARLGDKRAFKPLVRSLWSNNSNLTDTVVALGDLRDSECADHIIAIVNENDAYYPQAVQALAKIKDDWALRAIFDILRGTCGNFSPVVLTPIFKYSDDIQVISPYQEEKKASKPKETDDIHYFHPTETDILQEAIFSALKEATGQDFGTDCTKWLSWRKTQVKAAAKTGDKND